MDDARGAGVDIFTMGQYLQPTQEALAGRRVRYAGEVRALARAAKTARVPSGGLQPAFAQLVPRGAGLLAAQPRVPVVGLGANVTKVFLTRPVLAAVCSLIIMIARAGGDPRHGRSRSIRRSRRRWLPSARATSAPSPQAVEAQVTTPLEQAVNTVQGLRYISSTERAGHLDDHLHVHAGDRPRHRRRRRAEPRSIGDRAVAGDGAAGRRSGQQELRLVRPGHRAHVGHQTVRYALSQQLRAAQHRQRSLARSGRFASRDLRPAAVCDADLDQPASARAAGARRRRRRYRAAGAECRGRQRQHRLGAGI